MAHSVYLITSEGGKLLYVGCTNDVQRRLDAHRRSSPWFPQSHMVHHRAFDDRGYAERVEARAIRILRPEHNVKDNPRRAPAVSDKGRAAQIRAGSKFGRAPLIWKGDRGSKKRIAYLQDLEDGGQLRSLIDGEWVLTPKAADVAAELNKAKNRDRDDKDINNPETVRRWAREGFAGIKTEPE